jgi:hypothetical protein
VSNYATSISGSVTIIRAATRAVGQRLRQARALGASAAECSSVLRRILASNKSAHKARAFLPEDAAQALEDAAQEARTTALLARYLSGRTIGRYSRATIERALAETRAMF